MRKLKLIIVIAVITGMLSSLFCPVMAEAAYTLTDSDGTVLTVDLPDPILTDSCQNYIIYYGTADIYYLLVYDQGVNGNAYIYDDSGYAAGNNTFFTRCNYMYIYRLINGEWSLRSAEPNLLCVGPIDTIMFSSEDVYYNGSLFFQRTPSQTLIAGMITTSQVMTGIMGERIGLAPLVIGLTILAIALYKGLRSLSKLLKTL